MTQTLHGGLDFQRIMPSKLGVQIKLIAFCLFITPNIESFADVVFEFDYSQSSEFTDDDIGITRREALEDAAILLGSQFKNQATIQIEVTSENDPSSDTLASAASHVVDDPLDFFGYSPSVVERKVKEGIDANEAEADGVVTINFGIDWDLDDNISIDQYDFKATLIHELLHALGFASGISAGGEDAYGTLPGSPGVWSTFDEFLSDRDGNFLIDGEFILNEELWVQTSIGGSSPGAGLFFSGPKAVEANNGKPVGLFSPTTWSEGSSGSHLDDDNPAWEGFLMLSATTEGPYTRQLMEVERAMLTDIGYDMKPAPAEEMKIELAIAINETGAVLTLFGNPGTYQIEATSDLENWDIIGSVSIEVGQEETSFEEDLFEKQFYRALIE